MHTGSDNPPSQIIIRWDEGTAYDLFVSLLVLHQPGLFGLRGSWAAGVRSRLTSDDRKTLEDALTFLPVPLSWLYRLEGRKDAHAALDALRNTPAEQRLDALIFNPRSQPLLREIVQEVKFSAAFTREQAEELSVYAPFRRKPQPVEAASLSLRCWSDSQSHGERLMKALDAYAEGFFFEEEQRIRSALDLAQEKAREKAQRMPADALLEELSQGVKFPLSPDLKGLVLVPSYWITPLIVFEWVTLDSQLVLFGARPDDAHLVPGENIPDALLRSLKATADPTRLRILRHLAHESLTPSQLARLLRLRPPTVIHHLNELRLAGLVQITLVEEGERRYAIRKETVYQSFDALQKFLEISKEDQI